jgi:hypothetical protein
VMIGNIIQGRRYTLLRCNRHFHVNTPHDTSEFI